MMPDYRPRSILQESKLDQTIDAVKGNSALFNGPTCLMPRP